jgi:hypothetical protein
MPLRSVLLTAGFVLIGAVAPVGAGAAPLPVLGAPDGVQVSRSGEDLELRLTGASAMAAASYSGRTLSIDCARHAVPGLLFVAGSGSERSEASAKLQREADGTLSIRARMPDSMDVCSVPRPSLPEQRGRRQGPFRVVPSVLRPPLARVAMTPAGEQWLEELGHVQQLLAAGRSLGAGPSYPLPTATPSSSGLVPLDGPDASPPANQVGYWSDGAKRVALVTLSGAGRRLLTEDLGDGMVRTNLLAGFLSERDTGLGAPSYLFDVADRDPDARRAPHRRRDVVGHEDGVRGSVAGRRLTIRFTGRSRAALARIAGRRVSVTCAAAARSGGLAGPGASLRGYQLMVARVPRHGRTLHARARAGVRPDICSITDDGDAVARVAPTAVGRAALTDLAAALDLSAVTSLAPKGAIAYPAATTIAAKHPKQLVAMAGPEDRAPSGRTGVWTDGAQRAVLATTSATGRRLVLADEGNGVARNNLSTLASSTLLLTYLE